MPGRLENKVAVVTGGASGFGKGIAIKFAQEGAKVVIADLSEDAAQAVAQELGCVSLKADVTKREDWERILAETLSHYGQLDIVVNNAGTTYANKPTEQVTEADFDLVMNVNVKSIYISTSVIVDYFLKENRPGCFVQVASTAGLRPRPGLVWYNASKGAVITATKGLAVEYAPKQIRFNSVCPVVGLTAMYVTTTTFLSVNASRKQLTYSVGPICSLASPTPQRTAPPLSRRFPWAARPSPLILPTLAAIWRVTRRLLSPARRSKWMAVAVYNSGLFHYAADIKDIQFDRQ